MGRVHIIGAGGVGTVVAHKVAQNADTFTDIMIASRTRSKCDAIVKIPMAKGVESLNVSVAAGIAMYEVVRQFLAKAK